MNLTETRADAAMRRRRKKTSAKRSGKGQSPITDRTGRRRSGTPSLRAWRLERALSQLDAAAVLGISQTLYSRLERGTVSTKGTTAKRIVLVTGVPLEILVGAA